MESPLLLYRKGPGTPSLYCFLSHLIDMSRIARATPPDWLPEELKWSWFQDSPTALGKQHGGALRDINSDSPFSQPQYKFTEICPQVSDKQRSLMGRGYSGRVVRIKPTRHGGKAKVYP